MSLKKRLRAAFGKVPDPMYFDGDMKYIRAYYDYRRDNELDEFLIDEITWYDLDLDRVFKRINPKRCTSGEQYLYYMLRSPAVDAKCYAERKQLIDYAQADPERRLKAETNLARLGCSRRADLCRAFSPARHGIGLLLVFLLFVLALIGTGIFAAIGSGVERFYPLFGSLLLNCYIHEFGKRRSQRDYDTVNYVVNMIFAVRRLRKLRDSALDEQTGESYYIVETKSLKRILNAAEEASPLLCVVDEVLRGTNTVERIAASSEVLRAMADDGLLCLAATHDIELCELLQESFDLYHFEEELGENEMLFDYVIRRGKANSRNAINLLQLIGFNRQIVDRAHQKANRYLETGEWMA